jgi:hypothetical protein
MVNHFNRAIYLKLNFSPFSRGPAIRYNQTYWYYLICKLKRQVDAWVGYPLRKNDKD